MPEELERLVFSLFNQWRCIMALEPLDLIPRFAFWRDGCRTMAKSICEVLRLAGEPATPKNILAFVGSLPRDPGDLTSQLWQSGYCSSCLAKAYDKAPETDMSSAEHSLVGYFLRYFPERDRLCQLMLIDAFIGIINGLDSEGSESSGKSATNP
jgi:hypothetical protein